MDLSFLGTDLTVVVRTLLAAALAVPIGLEREVKGNPAGVRTHVVLATCAAALGWLSVVAAEGDSAADPTRIASYTVAGISFLGGGLIVGVHTRVHGLTTAVAAFTMTTIGLLCGMGYPLAAVALTVVTVTTLAPLDWIKSRTYGQLVRGEATLHAVVGRPAELPALTELFGPEIEVRAMEMQQLGDGAVLMQVTVRGLPEKIDDAEAALERETSVRSIGTIHG